MSARTWPPWWRWELEPTDHVKERMLQRGFHETDLRTMLTDALRLEPRFRSGRFVVHTRFAHRPWKVVVEPDPVTRRIVVITASRVD